MAVETLVNSRAQSTDPVPGHGFYGNAKLAWAVQEVSASASASSTYDLHILPSNARIHGASKVYFDDMATTGSPTVDIGCVVGASYDDDSVNDGLAVSSASTGASFVKDIANYGKYLWQLAGRSSDPGGKITIRAKLKDASVTTGGTFTSEVVYSLDN